MDDLRFCVLFNSVSVISGSLAIDKERLCAIELPFTVEKILPRSIRAGIELGRLDQ